MCESLAEGGRRCAAHTRPGYQAAMSRIAAAADPTERAEARATGTGEVAAYASTRSGRTDVEAAQVDAEGSGDWETSAWLTTALRIGGAQSEAASEIKRVIQAERAAIPLGDINPGEVLCLKDGAVTHHGVAFMRRGTYVKVLRLSPDGSEVTVVQLPFRGSDENRVKRGPVDATLSRTTDNCAYTVPRALLGRPGEGDDTAAYYTQRPYEREGDWHTPDEAAVIRTEEEEIFSREDLESNMEYYLRIRHDF